MPTIWVYRLHAITEQAAANASNSFWTLIAPGDPEAEARSYGVPLSATGQEPATHCGISSAFNAEMLAKMKVLDELATLRYYVCDAWSFALLEQRGGGLVLGQPCSWEDALEDAGLQTIQPEELL